MNFVDNNNIIEMFLKQKNDNFYLLSRFFVFKSYVKIKNVMCKPVF